MSGNKHIPSVFVSVTYEKYAYWNVSKFTSKTNVCALILALPILSVDERPCCQPKYPGTTEEIER